MDFKTFVAVAVFCVVSGSVSAVDISKLKPYNLTAQSCLYKGEICISGIATFRKNSLPRQSRRGEGERACVSAVDMSKLKPYNLTAAALFIQEDRNQDGLISIAENEAVFDRFDSNHDGRESRNEYTQMTCAEDPDLYQISHYLFDDYDINGDHHLEKADYDGWHAKIDVNHDGNVSQEEFVNYWVALLTHIEQQEAQHQHGNSHEHGHCPGTG